MCYDRLLAVHRKGHYSKKEMARGRKSDRERRLAFLYYGNGAGFRTNVKTDAAGNASFRFELSGKISHDIQVISLDNTLLRAMLDTQVTCLALVRVDDDMVHG
jgi:hypothetical protein